MRGFTLLEVIIAFAVLGLALILLLGTLTGAARQVRWSSDAGRAALHAQSLFDQFGVGTPLPPGRSDGELEVGRYRWTLEVSPYADASRPPQPLVDPAAPKLMLLALDVQWGDGGPREHLRMQSLRLQAPTLEESAIP